jgi:putative hydrolase of the HAD superfamily
MNQSTARPRAIFFDAGGTLIAQHPSPEAITERALATVAPELLPLDGRALDRHIEARILAHRAGGRLVHFPAPSARAFWTETYRSFLADRLPPDRATQAAEALLAAFTDLGAWALYPDAPAALVALRESGLTLGLLSNWEDWLDELLAALELRDAFRHVLVSGVLGMEKPDPAIFRHALAVTGLTPAELVYVGDSPHHDVDPCLTLGIQPVLIDRHDRHPDVPGCIRIGDLRDLPAALGVRGQGSGVREREADG